MPVEVLDKFKVRSSPRGLLYGQRLRRAEEHKDSNIDLELTIRQQDESFGEVNVEARKRHEQRCQKEVTRLRDLVTFFLGKGNRTSTITVEGLEHAKPWARCSLEGKVQPRALPPTPALCVTC